MTNQLSPGEPSAAVNHGPGSTLVARTIHFICAHLSNWRDDPDRPKEQAEDRLNTNLCDYLDSLARDEFPMVRFSHEEPQVAQRSVDMAAKPVSRAMIRGRNYTKYDAFLVIEGKRLPSPDVAREREYVTRVPKTTGGIQRFKLGLYGREHVQAVIIGYVQSKDLYYWWTTINRWIADLSGTRSADGCVWDTTDLLRELSVDHVADMGRCSSTHSRSDDASTNQIDIEHLWIIMGKSPLTAKSP